jgi:choline kinase
MKAIMLAAGVGRRLYGDDDSQPPKALLRFAGKSLLERHVEILRSVGIDEMVVVVGFRKEAIEEDIDRIGAADFVRTVENPEFREGPVISLWAAREEMRAGDSILFMDADVLYHRSLIDRLVETTTENCFLLDRNFEVGEDPVRLCIRDDVPVDFGKMIEGQFDVVGEWPGFLRLSPDMARRVADETQTYVDRGKRTNTYEEAVRDVLLAAPSGSFGFVDITGIPWIEIDFPSDLLRAQRLVMPRLSGEDGATAPPPSVRSRDRASGE